MEARYAHVNLCVQIEFIFLPGVWINQSSSDSENIDPLTDLEKELFEIVNNGHPQDVYNFLRLNKTVDINKRDIEVWVK